MKDTISEAAKTMSRKQLKDQSYMLFDRYKAEIVAFLETWEEKELSPFILAGAMFQLGYIAAKKESEGEQD